MRLLLPLILALLGTGAGIGAGLFLAPAPDAPESTGATDQAEGGGDQKSDAGDDKGDAASGGKTAAKESGEDLDSGYVKLNNQFIVPVIEDDRVRSIVVVSLSVEVPPGQTEAVYAREPKLRDAFLQVLFDHANIGGFEGAFTTSPRMDGLRKSLVKVAARIIGPDLRNVLITDISRQDT